MGKRRRPRHKRWGMPEDRKEPLSARISVLLLLVNLFVWAGLRATDILLVTLLSSLLAIAGAVIGHMARRKVKRHGGRVAGESLALIGYWANLIVAILSLLMFAYAVAMGVLRGDLL